MTVTSAEIAEILEKYRAILRLRRGEEEAPIAAMRTLSRRFPGSLRELDELTLAILQGKVSELDALVSGATDDVPRWLVVQVRFHALLRGALLAKRYLGRREAEAISSDHFKKWTDDADAHAWSTDLAAVMKPPRGRLLDLVFARVAGELDLEVDEVRRLVFTTTRRPAPR